MSDEKLLQEGKGMRPTSQRPGFPEIRTADMTPSETRGKGVKPPTTRPNFPEPVQPQQTQPAQDSTGGGGSAAPKQDK